ncbi:MAG: asparagine synthase (glutamine-hydrolyzing) [Rhodospirillales bacterium]
MCGLVGVFNKDRRPADPELLTNMCGVISYRGPDAEGVRCESHVGFAHRRLSVIDLQSRSNQPLSSACGRITVIFNGMIYNFQELRRALEKEGAQFSTQSDTEVLIWGYLIWGIEKLVRSLNCMAAFALWDAAEQRLFLVRDRYGCKPLYIWETSESIFFASEIKAFIRHPDFKVQVNESALNEYFTFQNLFRDHTLFKGVDIIPAGVIGEIGQGTIDYRRYWDFDFLAQDETLDFETSAEQTKELLKQAVHRQMQADVPVGAYLSSGMDSGSIVSIAAGHAESLSTFTAGFEVSGIEGIEATFDERIGAESLAHHFHTEHYERIIHASDMESVLPRMIWHLEDIRIGMSYPNFYVAQLASKFVKVCLSGAGGDELFGGYPWRYFKLLDGGYNPENYMTGYYDFWQRLVKDDEKKKLFSNGIYQRTKDDHMLDVFKGVFEGNLPRHNESIEDQVAAALYFESKTFLHGLLVVGDRLSAAHGLEERFPFLDNDLVDFAQKIPVRHKIADLKGGHEFDENLTNKRLQRDWRFSSGKSVLRQAMYGLIPQETRQRYKQGFSAPDETWFRGEKLAYIQSLLLNGSPASADFINPDYVRGIIEEHTSGRSNHRLLIWSFVCFEWWCRVFLLDDIAKGDHIVCRI